MKKLAFLIVVSLLMACQQQDAGRHKLGTAQGDLGNGYFLNPILGGDYPDPTIMREGNDYYMTHSSFDYVPGLVVFHSTDLVNWQPISFALRRYLGSIWAPDICKHGDRYYIYFTVAHPSGRMNFVTYADSPYGPWSDPIDLKVGNIDPGHAVGEDGSRWIFLSAGQRARLSDDGLSIVPGSLEKVYEGWIYPSEWVTEGMCLEGPKMRKIGDYFYYLNAEGGTAGPPTSHMVVAARSKSINGPGKIRPIIPLFVPGSAASAGGPKGMAP
ncbi:MAG: family 43 glycosylhydrolase [Bacteroidales bacterium]|nr:family 43 glycosylhydrolase [Bacteroidales bacterium]MDD4641464.1 family 43 glycosylhydrolase [Bacteroidales bacterium]